MSLRDVLNLVFPRTCPGCGKLTVRQEGAVCLECLTEVRQTRFHRSPTDNELYLRVAGKVPLAGASAFLYFDKEGRVQQMVQALKYRNQPGVGTYLGEVWADSMRASEWWQGINVLVPVPLHRSRRVERGYNQAEMIAAGLGKVGGKPVVKKALVRKEQTQTQTRKGKEERWKNVRDVFSVKGRVTGHVGLVDDVATTGATLEACIRALLASDSPPRAISVLCLAMASND